MMKLTFTKTKTTMRLLVVILFGASVFLVRPATSFVGVHTRTTGDHHVYSRCCGSTVSTLKDSQRRQQQQRQQQRSRSGTLETTTTTTRVGFYTLSMSSVPSDVSYSSSSTSSSSSSSLDSLKIELINACIATNSNKTNKPNLDTIKMLVKELETLAEELGIGQASSVSGFLSGEWELLYAPTDITRSSPFFWAFEKAFPDQADQIFSITDAIPAPLKEVGPATQTIQLSSSSSSPSSGGGTTTSTTTTGGKLISKVKVTTLNGMSSSMMVTKADIVGTVGVDGLTLRIDTTKPEDSTFVKVFFPGPIGPFVDENIFKPFPSGRALEQIMPGSSTVTMKTTFCDDGLRISRNGARYDDPFIWRRLKFTKTEEF